MTTRSDALSRSAAASIPSAARIVIRMLERIEGGCISLRLPNGDQCLLGDGALVATLEVTDWSVFELILGEGSIGFGEAYMEGLWQADHLAALLSLLASNRRQLERAIHGNVLRVLGHRLWHLLRMNTRRGARRNIEAHYDLGNEFYALWLDETMTYSSALFETPGQALADAQRAKYRRMLQQIGARPGQHILEIGCGWGGFAEVAATEFDCKVHGITLSPSQLAWAQQRAERGGFADRAVFELRDYRDLAGQWDHIVSIEMIEAVGERYWPSYFAQLKACVRPGGRIAVQGIVIDDALFAHYRRDVDFIQRHIFPGGMLLSPQQVRLQAKRAGLEVLDEHAFGIDYAETLARWMTRFNAVAKEVAAQGFDARFMRMWQFYLAYCEAGFRARNTDVLQYLFAHEGDSPGVGR